MIAVEVHSAELAGVPLNEATSREGDYPHLCRAHAFIGDILAMTVPEELRQWVLRVHRMPMPPVAEELRNRLAFAAATRAGPDGAAAKFILFESTRATMKIAAWRTNGDFEAIGGEDAEIDRIAAEEVDWMIQQATSLPSDIRSLNVLVANAMVKLSRYAEELRHVIQGMQKEIVERFAEVAAVERSLRQLDPVDAVLVRNQLAPCLGEQQLSVEELQRQHPALLAPHSRAALDQRLCRLKQRLRARGPTGLPRRQGATFFQLMTDLDGDAR